MKKLSKTLKEIFYLVAEGDVLPGEIDQIDESLVDVDRQTVAQHLPTDHCTEVEPRKYRKVNSGMRNKILLSFDNGCSARYGVIPQMKGWNLRMVDFILHPGLGGTSCTSLQKTWS
jgi:hypothetical protein